MAAGRPPTTLQLHDRAGTPCVRRGEIQFGWQCSDAMRTQRAYHIRILHDPDPASEVAWDSGTVDSGATAPIHRPADALDERTRYWWTVRVSGTDREWTAWAPPQRLDTAIEGWTAQWLAPAGPSYESTPAPAPVFRREFSLEGERGSVDHARLDLVAGGTAVPELNGSQATDAALGPELTDYADRVLATTHDVTDRLRDGDNAIAIRCGRDRYAMTADNPWGWDQTPWQRDHPEIRAELAIVYEDGSEQLVVTDDEWAVAATGTSLDSLYMGERHDARRSANWSDPDDPPRTESGWYPPAIVSGPGGSIVQQVHHPITVSDRRAPQRVDRLGDGSVVLDFGTVLAGWIELDLDLPAGTELRVEHGEKLAEDGSVPTEQSHFSLPFQTDTYVAGSDRDTWSPSYTYKGFRYVQVDGLPPEGDPESITAIVAHNDIDGPSESSFTCANTVLNAIQENTRRALLSNHHGMPTDTPAYEKHGWTGDAQITAPTALYNFAVRPLHRKFVRDMADAQRDSGELPPFVPTSDWGYSEGAFDEPFTAPLPAWDAAYVLMPWWLYRFHGDRDVLAQHYEGMRSLVRYHADHLTEGVLDEGLGDWFPPGHGEITWNPPEGPALTSTAYHCRSLELLGEIADVLGHEDDRRRYRNRATAAIGRFNAAFFDEEAGVYRTAVQTDYRQTSNLFPLAFDYVPDGHRSEVYSNLRRDVRDRQGAHLNTGILGTRFLLPVLTGFGDVDLAYTVATQRSYPGWGYWIDSDITGLCEAWEPEARSHNHHMFGSIGEWYYADLLGIRPGSPGFERTLVAPTIPEDLEWAAGTADTCRGHLRVRWDHTVSGVRYEIEAPPSMTVVAALPGGEPTIEGPANRAATSLTADDTEGWMSDGAVRGARDLDDRTVLRLPSGRWTIDTRR